MCTTPLLFCPRTPLTIIAILVFQRLYVFINDAYVRFLSCNPRLVNPSTMRLPSMQCSSLHYIMEVQQAAHGGRRPHDTLQRSSYTVFAFHNIRNTYTHRFEISTMIQIYIYIYFFGGVLYNTVPCHESFFPSHYLCE